MKSLARKTYLAGNIARALAVFSVDEVVIFHDTSKPPRATHADVRHVTATSDPSHFLAHLLSFLETPPPLRKLLFPIHPNLEQAGTLPSLDMPHHMRRGEKSAYREGVIVDKQSVSHRHLSTNGDGDSPGTYIDTGLPTPHFLPEIHIPKGQRVTLRMKPSPVPVPPTEPRQKDGLYWGYAIRSASSLSAIFTECPYPSGYTLSIGTSERGKLLHDINPPPAVMAPAHVLVVFGGLAGLEAAADADRELHKKGIAGGNVSELFDEWVNVVPGQGSRTIRTEEAIWCCLTALRGWGVGT